MAPLDPWIIEEIIRQEREKKEREEQQRIELPIDRPGERPETPAPGPATLPQRSTKSRSTRRSPVTAPAPSAFCRPASLFPQSGRRLRWMSWLDLPASRPPVR